MTVGEEIEIVGIHPETEKTVITGLEMFQKMLDYAQAGDNAGALLRGIKREDVERGQAMGPARSRHTHYKAEVRPSKDEGGRHTPFFDGYRPQFYFRTTDVTGSTGCPRAERCAHEQHEHGDSAHSADRQTTQDCLAIREGGRTVGQASSRRSSRRAGPPPSSPEPMAQQKIRIRLKGHDHQQVDRLASHRDGAAHRRDHHRAGAAADGEERLSRIRSPSRTRTAGALRGAHAQAPHRHPLAHAKTVDSLMRLDLPAGVDIEIKLAR